MLSQGQMHIVNTGENLTLHCEFHAAYFNLFDNPVIWMKGQHHEMSEMNIMGNVKSPFKESDRFNVTFYPLPPRYVLGITIWSE